MLKKHVLGGALFLTSLFILSSCGEMSSWDNPVSSYLRASDQSPVIGIGEAYKITKNTDFTTISDATPEFTIAEESKGIAVVDKESGLVEGLKSGDAKIVISLPKDKDGLYLAAVDTFTVKVRVKNGEQFAVNVGKLGAEDQILLDENAEINIADALDLSGKKVTILGEKGKEAKIKPSKAIIVNSNFTLSNVEIDASGFVYNKDVDDCKAILLLAPLPDGTTQIDIDAIRFDNVVVKSLNANLINSYKKVYFIKDLTINDCIIGLGGSNYVFDLQNGGNVGELTISNSTLWASSTKKHTSRLFQQQSGKKPSELGGTTFTFTLENSTLYNISNGHNYVNYLRQNNQNWIIYNVNNNIIVDCQKSGSFIKGINGNNNDNDCKCTWNVSNNMINYGGSDVSETEVTNMDSNKYTDKNPRVKNCIKGVVSFAKPDNGDFSQTGVNAGDPRWRK